MGVDNEFEGTSLPVLDAAHSGALKGPGANRGYSGGERNADPEAAGVLRPPQNALEARCFEFGAEVPHVDTH
jgi:hypothetical protein